MNILFFLIPKINVVCVKQDYTLRQALEKMHAHRYSVIPIVTRSGEYVGTLSEGDILWFLKEHQNLDLNATDDIKITDIERYRSYSSINVMQNMEDLIHIATVLSPILLLKLKIKKKKNNKHRCVLLYLLK